MELVVGSNVNIKLLRTTALLDEQGISFDNQVETLASDQVVGVFDVHDRDSDVHLFDHLGHSFVHLVVLSWSEVNRVLLEQVSTLIIEFFSSDSKVLEVLGVL